METLAPEIVNSDSPRFTIDGSPSLERRLDALCALVRDAVLSVIPAECLEAIILGGGYGRGEGGVLKTGAGDEPYNDLEFYICCRGWQHFNEARFSHALARLHPELSRQAKIEIELKLISLNKISKSPVSMFFYDLASGHKVIYGQRDSLALCRNHLSAGGIPLEEATRLLMNRCSGLLFARERLTRSPFGIDDSDFVYRNIAKAKLALGDVILTESGQYHWSCRERHQRLQQLQAHHNQLSDVVLSYHAQGVAFKLHPVRSRSQAAQLEAELQPVSDAAHSIWLWLESRRLHRVFRNVQQYCLTPLKKCSQGPPLKNLLLSLRTFGPSSLLSPSSTRYPRERLLSTLPLLLWETDTLSSPILMAHIQASLRTPHSRFQDIVRAYERIWSVYN